MQFILLAVIKNYNNEFLTIWENAHAIIYKWGHYKNSHEVYGKEGLIITKPLYSKEWSYCKFFLVCFFLMHEGCSQKQTSLIKKESERK